MKAQHTPERWELQHRPDGSIEVWNVSGTLPIAVVCYYPTERFKENAHLIAAAPELLEALQELFEHTAMIHKHWGDGCNQKQADIAIAKGKAAIASATGKAGE